MLITFGAGLYEAPLPTTGKSFLTVSGFG